MDGWSSMAFTFPRGHPIYLGSLGTTNEAEAKPADFSIADSLGQERINYDHGTFQTSTR